ncbi:MAG: hypothetical protein KC917_12055 [Candidatus Omnitrophica bacterium]|nr:hypothetical protein [Candidatus Omnitrophota bacterium]
MDAANPATMILLNNTVSNADELELEVDSQQQPDDSESPFLFVWSTGFDLVDRMADRPLHWKNKLEARMPCFAIRKRNDQPAREFSIPIFRDSCLASGDRRGLGRDVSIRRIVASWVSAHDGSFHRCKRGLVLSGHTNTPIPFQSWLITLSQKAVRIDWRKVARDLVDRSENSSSVTGRTTVFESRTYEGPSKKSWINGPSPRLHQPATRRYNTSVPTEKGADWLIADILIEGT